MKRLLSLTFLLPLFAKAEELTIPIKSCNSIYTAKVGRLYASYEDSCNCVAYYFPRCLNPKNEEKALLEAIERTEKDSTYQCKEEALKAFYDALKEIREKLNK